MTFTTANMNLINSTTRNILFNSLWSTRRRALGNTWVVWITASCPSEDAFKANDDVNTPLEGNVHKLSDMEGPFFFFFFSGKTPNEIQGSEMVLSPQLQQESLAG